MGKWTQEQINEMIGRQFNRLTVVARAEDKIRKDNARIRQWYVYCQCNKERVFIVNENSLMTGHTKSCGCLMREKSAKIGYNNIKDITGQRFGSLVVIRRVENAVLSGGRRQDTQWECKCDCGNTKIVRRNQLINNKCKSCGCITSFAEKRITSILLENKISYKPQYTFNDLRSEINGILRYDFGVLGLNNELKYLIEYDGAQHYEEAGGTWQPLQYVQVRDEAKNNYCKSHNIPLIRIPNIDPDIITIDDLRPDTTRYLVA